MFYIRYFITVLLLAAPTVVAAQSAEWMHTFNPSTYTDVPNDIAVDANGNLYSVGDRGFIDKIDPYGNVVWTRNMEPQGADIDIRFVEVHGSNLWIAGTAGAWGNVDLDPGPGTSSFFFSSSAYQYVFFGVYDLDCNAQWVHTFEFDNAGAQPIVPWPKFALDTAGNLVLTTVYDQNTDIEPGPGTTMISSNRRLLAKYTPNGSLIWHTTFGHLFHADLAITPGNNAFVRLRLPFASSATSFPNAVNGPIALGQGDHIVKFNHLGQAENSWTFATGPNMDILHKIQGSPSGGFYLMGRADSLDLDPDTSAQMLILDSTGANFLAHYDDNMSLLWATNLEASPSETPIALRWWEELGDGSIIGTCIVVDSVHLATSPPTMIDSPNGLHVSATVTFSSIGELDSVWTVASSNVSAADAQYATDTQGNIFVAMHSFNNGSLTTTPDWFGGPVSGGQYLLAKLDCGGPTISQPTTQVGCQGDTIVFVCSATDSSASHQWQMQLGGLFEDINDSVQWWGTTTDTLWLILTPATDSANVRCLVSNGCTTTSFPAAATIEALTPLNITASTSIVCSSDSITYSASGMSSYLWSSGSTDSITTVINTDTIALQATTPAGCLAADSLIVQTNPSPSVTITPGDTTICTGDSILLTTSQAFPAYAWNTGSSTTTAPTTTIYGSSTVELIVQDTNGCTASDTISITEYGPVFSLPNDTSLCPNSSLPISSPISASSYLWSNGATTTSIVGVVGNTYSLTLTDILGCSSTDSIVLSLLPTPQTVPLSDTTVCNSDTVTYSLSGFSSYVWNSGSSDSTAWIASTGSISFQATTVDGCLQNDSAYITFAPLPAMFLLGNDTSICPSDSVLVSTNTNFTNYVWSNGSTAASSLVSDSGLVWVSVVDSNGCQGSDSLLVMHFSPPTVELGNDTSLCIGDSLLLQLPTAFSAYQWTNGTLADSIWGISGIAYGVTVTDTNGCQAEDSISVGELSAPAVWLGNDTSLCPSDSILIGVSAGYAATYQWNTGASSDSIWGSGGSLYYITVVDTFGCTGSDSIIVSNLSPVGIQVDSSGVWCPGDTIELACNLSSGQFAWNTGSSMPVIEVVLPGWYSVTHVDTSGCTSGDSVLVLSSDTILTGTLVQSTGAAHAGTAIIVVSYNPVDSSLAAVDTVHTDGTGNFSIVQTLPEIYLKAIPDSLTYPNELPTYFAGSITFPNSSSVFAMCGTTNVSFATFAGNNPGGPGFISGTISQGAGKTAGSSAPIAGLPIFLISPDSNVIIRAITSTSGTFVFASVPLGEYQIVVDYPHINNYLAPTILVTSGNPSHIDLQLHLQIDHLELIGTWAPRKYSEEVRLTVYPNPADQQLNVVCSNCPTTPGIWRIVDGQGRVVNRGAIPDSGNRFYLPTQDLKSGVYYMNLVWSEYVAGHRFVRH